MARLKVLFLAADPFADDPDRRLRVDEETRAIQARIRESRYRSRVQFETRLAARPGDLLQVLNEVRPHVVHFSGHGTEDGSIVLTGDDDLPHAVPAETMARLFRAAKDDIRLVVLNACWSSILARQVAQVVDAAIGMRGPLHDGSAIAFSAQLYGGLGFGRSVESAVEQARVLVELEDRPGSDVPELFGRPGFDLSRTLLVSGGFRTPCDPAVAVVRDELRRDLGNLAAYITHTRVNVPCGDPVPQRLGETRTAYEDRDRRWFADALRDTFDGYGQFPLETAGYAAVRMSLARCDAVLRQSAERAYDALTQAEARLAMYRHRLNGLVDGSRSMDERRQWASLYSRQTANALAILWFQAVEGWAMLEPDPLDASLVETTLAPGVLPSSGVSGHLLPGVPGRAWALAASAALHGEKAALIQEEMQLSASRAAAPAEPPADATAAIVRAGLAWAEGRAKDALEALDQALAFEDAPELQRLYATASAAFLRDADRYDGVMGTFVFDADPDGPGAQAGLRRGDVIVRYNGEPVTEPYVLSRLISQAHGAPLVPVEVVRGDGRIRLFVKGGVSLGARGAALVFGEAFAV